MKSSIHPKWHNDTKVTCSCGEEFITGSTQESIQVDICSACHPFYTGEMRFVDVQGRVEKFQAKQKKGAQYQKQVKQKKETEQKKQQEAAKSLKEVLTQMKKDIPSAQDSSQNSAQKKTKN